MKALDGTRFRFWWAAVGFFTLLAGDAFRYSVTWGGFGVVVLVVSTISVLILWRTRESWRIAALPYPLLVFTALSTISIAWSAYPSSSAVGIVATLLTITSAVAFAVVFTWTELLRILGFVLRVILGASIVFELFVSVVLRHPLLPFWYEYDLSKKLPGSLYWSRDLLLEGGKIQGIVGNSALLGFVALLGVIVFAIQLAGGTVRRVPGALWLAFALVMIVLTRSATITLALVVVAAVAASILIIRLARTPRTRLIVSGAIGAVLVVGAILAVVLRETVFSLLGKGDTLTGRSDIWTAVIDLAQQRPVFGWGWVSYWTPWAEPLNSLAFEGGVHQYQAHNAWLDVWLQLGVVGLVVFAALVLSTLVRAWFHAVDRPALGPSREGPFTATTLLPILIVTALIVQSLAESRMLVEYGLVLISIAAIKTKIGERGTLP